MPITFVLRRFDGARLKGALGALAVAIETGDREPLYPWLETWRIDGVVEHRQRNGDDLRAMLEKCAVGRNVDLLDRSPGALAGCADRELTQVLQDLDRGAGLEDWARPDLASDAAESVRGLLWGPDVTRLAPRVAALNADAVLVEWEDLATYAPAWEALRRTFAVAAQRGDGIALLEQR